MSVIIDREITHMDTRISEKIEQYMQTLRFFEENIDDYIYIYNLTMERVYFTGRIQEKFKIPMGKDSGFDFSKWNDIVYPKDRELVNHYKNLLIQGVINSFNIAYRLIDRAENKVWVSVKGTLRKEGNCQLLVGRISEISSDRLIDSLTGLGSIKKFMEDMKRCLKFADGYLMVLGIDNFKNINIIQGRSQGDTLLKKIAGILEDHLDYPTSLYRLDGDCFAVNLPRKKKDEVISFYYSIRTALQNICTISAGVVAYTHGEEIDGNSTFQYAENALNQAKKEGKDRMVFFSADNYQKDLKQVELLDELRASVLAGCKDFYLCYQPQVRRDSYEIYGVEALLRYKSPTRGIVSPVEFIPLLEENGLICTVGEWVLKTAVSQCRQWRKHIPNLHVSVNFSYIQLEQENIADTVLECLKAADLPGEALTVELTESIQLHNYRYFNRIFSTWKECGIKISIDDFGTGYSSLSYLKSIEADEVKIDRAFVTQVQKNAYNYHLLSNIIELAHSAQIWVCCEGVETTEELMALQSLSADILQGYLFAQPYTKEVFEQTYILKESKAYQARITKESHFHQIDPSINNELLMGLRNEELVNIVEGMEELIYVSDVATYELYYMNATGRSMTGGYNYTGCKCYQVLQGRDSPCEFCTNHQLSQDEFYVWENRNEYLNRHYILKDKLIPWQGKIVRLELAFDITDKEIVSQTIQKKLRFEEAIVDASKILASENSAEESICDVIKRIGEFCQGDRAYVLKRKKNQKLWDLSCEWCREGIPSIHKFYPAQSQYVSQQSAEKRIAEPIMRNGLLMGYICVDNPRKAEEGADFAKTMAGFLGYSMIGEETQEKLNKLLEVRYQDIRSHTGLGLWVIRINPETGEKELYPDQVLRELMGMEENLTPAEKYDHWYSNIKDGYFEYVNEKVEKMISSGEITHLEYPWKVSGKEEVIVHCVGIRRKDSSGMIWVEGYHWVMKQP